MIITNNANDIIIQYTMQHEQIGWSLRCLPSRVALYVFNDATCVDLRVKQTSTFVYGIFGTWSLCVHFFRALEILRLYMALRRYI